VVVKFLIDTNAALYFLHGRLMQALPKGEYSFSVISEIELLAYPSLSAAEERSIRRLLAAMKRVDLDESVRQKTIAIRRGYRMKLPDAVIAASAWVHGATLLSNDTGFDRIADLPRLELPLKPLLENP
jgi:predicted nucleic acid-binding protein